MKKILGAHNANTYLKPRKWWMRLINFTSKCQRLTIEEQLEHGVRYFDFRIRWDEELKMFINCHGLVEYKEPLLFALNRLTHFVFINPTEKIYIRFVYDDTFNHNSKGHISISNLFRGSISPIFKFDENISWELIIKSSWNKIDCNRWKQPEVVDCFRNYRDYKWIPFPQRYISKHKKHYQKIIDNTKVEKDTVFLCDRVDLFKIK